MKILFSLNILVLFLFLSIFHQIWERTRNMSFMIQSLFTRIIRVTIVPGPLNKEFYFYCQDFLEKMFSSSLRKSVLLLKVKHNLIFKKTIVWMTT